jgi:hypothetical protein
VRVRIDSARRPKEPAKLAINITDIRRIKMAVDVKVSCATVQPTAHGVGKLCQCRQVVSCIKLQAIVKRKPFVALNSGSNLIQVVIV